MRLAEPTDIDSLVRVYQDAVTHANEVGKIDWPNPITTSFIDDLLVDGDLYSFGEATVAAAKLSPKANQLIWGAEQVPALYISKLATSQRVRGQDYFRTTMLPAIIDFASYCKLLRLDCLADNAALQRYYRKLGFVGIANTSFFSVKQQKAITVTRFEMGI